MGQTPSMVCCFRNQNPADDGKPIWRRAEGDLSDSDDDAHDGSDQDHSFVAPLGGHSRGSTCSSASRRTRGSVSSTDDCKGAHGRGSMDGHHHPHHHHGHGSGAHSHDHHHHRHSHSSGTHGSDAPSSDADAIRGAEGSVVQGSHVESGGRFPKRSEFAILVEQADQARVEEILEVAKVVEGLCRKNPTSGKSFFKSSKDRWVVAVPAPDGDASTWGAKLQQWRRGHLAYWENEAAYRKNAQPKGKIDLISITKVSLDESDVEAVIVKYVQGETTKLVLHFQDVRRADAWRNALRRLRALL